jgi:aryl-alcohol dehydrogenase-like predicted oxidoreductase
MEYTKLGRSGLDVSRICLGCMSYGGGNRRNHAWSLGEEESRPFIKRAQVAAARGIPRAQVALARLLAKPASPLPSAPPSSTTSTMRWPRFTSSCRKTKSRRSRSRTSRTLWSVSTGAGLVVGRRCGRDHAP